MFLFFDVVFWIQSGKDLKYMLGRNTFSKKQLKFLLATTNAEIKIQKNISNFTV